MPWTLWRHQWSTGIVARTTNDWHHFIEVSVAVYKHSYITNTTNCFSYITKCEDKFQVNLHGNRKSYRYILSSVWWQEIRRQDSDALCCQHYFSDNPVKFSFCCPPKCAIHIYWHWSHTECMKRIWCWSFDDWLERYYINSLFRCLPSLALPLHSLPHFFLEH